MRISTQVGSFGRPCRFGAAIGEIVIPLRSAKVRAEASDDITVPLPEKPKIVTRPPLYGLIGSSVPFTSMTRDVLPRWGRTRHPASAGSPLSPQLQQNCHLLLSPNQGHVTTIRISKSVDPLGVDGVLVLKAVNQRPNEAYVIDVFSFGCECCILAAVIPIAPVPLRVEHREPPLVAMRSNS